MAGYGSWDDRPWERREGGRDWDRWREERRRAGRDEPWRGRGEEEPGSRGREEEWRGRDEWRGEEVEGRGRVWRAGERGEREWEPEQRRSAMRESEWERGERRGGGWRPEIDPPWVERGPQARSRGESRGLVEWEDRGPLSWLGDKVRRATRPSRGPKGYTRSDERIHEDLCERIARSGVDADEVEVRVEKREVTLTGSVRTREEKWWLEDLADDVFGVEEVHNQLRVVRADPASRSAAPEAKPGMRH